MIGQSDIAAIVEEYDRLKLPHWNDGLALCTGYL